MHPAVIRVDKYTVSTLLPLTSSLNADPCNYQSQYLMFGSSSQLVSPEQKGQNEESGWRAPQSSWKLHWKEIRSKEVNDGKGKQMRKWGN